LVTGSPNSRCAESGLRHGRNDAETGVGKHAVAGVAEPLTHDPLKGRRRESMRVWEPFLTERDREHARLYWGKTEAFGLGTKPVLLVIDNIYGILGPREPLMDVAGALPASCGLEGWTAIDKTVELIAAARRHEVPVIYAKLLDAMPPRGSGRRGPDPERLPATIVERLSEIVDDIAPQPGDFVIEKTSASMFAGTPLMYYLTQLGADTVVCCGNSTSGCVRATVVDANACRLHVGLVEECTFDRTEASHAMSLFDMHVKYADVMSIAETAEYFASVSVREGAVAGH
jgi:nicotinamidase-related amidase